MTMSMILMLSAVLSNLCVVLVVFNHYIAKVKFDISSHIMMAMSCIPAVNILIFVFLLLVTPITLYVHRGDKYED